MIERYPEKDQHSHNWLSFLSQKILGNKKETFQDMVCSYAKGEFRHLTMLKDFTLGRSHESKTTSLRTTREVKKEILPQRVNIVTRGGAAARYDTKPDDHGPRISSYSIIDYIEECSSAQE